MVFIIAEIGINHNGSMDICKKLIDVAANSGCNAVKFQKRDIDSVYTQEFLDSPRESPWGSTQRDQKRGLEFSHSQYLEIDKYCRSLNIEWLASAWDLKSQHFLRQFKLKYNKIASAMLAFIPFLEAVASERRHTFISTGMSSYDDISAAISIFQKHDCPFELMHAVSLYPLPADKVNLQMIKTLQDRYSCDVGYSGHEPGVIISHAAVALGITSLERHITLDRSMYGSDQSASLEPNGLRKLVQGVRKITTALGDGQTRQINEEMQVATKLRAHL